MSTTERTPETHAGDPERLDGDPWHAREAAAAVAALGSDAERGLTQAEAAERLARDGPNEITGEKPPSVWAIALAQLRDPMNLMLVAVTVVSFVIGEVSTGVIVAFLILLNVVLGTRQELKARASVDALSKMQVPQTRVLRTGQLVQVPAIDVVPGDIVQVEAGDIVPADGRIMRSATLETQEAALTGESAPIAKDAAVVPRRGCAARRPHEHAVPEHVGDARDRRRWSSPRPAWRPRWARSPRC